MRDLSLTTLVDVGNVLGETKLSYGQCGIDKLV